MPELERIYKSTFEAGHLIEGHPKCGIQHGHSYNLTVYLEGYSEKWLDFTDIKYNVDNYVQTNYDHKFLGSKSAEEIAEEIAMYLKEINYHGELELYETSKYGIRLVF